ncbi:hypothetical protein SpCBS45565_g01719 [Spizellomyces sp. 'palustris']|nr:hypothetical protein SpCBS45565_g01719 [Spizellomyces sp. 'palustris']
MGLFDNLPPPVHTTPPAPTTCSLFGSLPPASSQKRKTSSELSPNESKAKRPSNGAPCELVPQQANTLSSVRGHACTCKGRREYQQDRFVSFDEECEEWAALVKASTKCAEVEPQSRTPSWFTRIAYYGVFDGHGGSLVSTFCEHHLHEHLVKLLSRPPPVGPTEPVETRTGKRKESPTAATIRSCVLDAFKSCDGEILSTWPEGRDGAVGIIAIVVDEWVCIAWVGDCKSVWCEKDEKSGWTAVCLTKDHVPTVWEERRRIQKAGGHVKDGRVLGRLEVSRAFGDARFKQYGVISTPHIIIRPLSPGVLILACDGVWKALTIDQVRNIVADEIGRKDKVPWGERVSEAVVKGAVVKGADDNVTVIIIVIGMDGDEQNDSRQL